MTGKDADLYFINFSALLEGDKPKHNERRMHGRHLVKPTRAIFLNFCSHQLDLPIIIISHAFYCVQHTNLIDC